MLLFRYPASIGSRPSDEPALVLALVLVFLVLLIEFHSF